MTNAELIKALRYCGGEMPPMPEIESACILGQLNQIVAMNVDLCKALKVICEVVGA